MYHNRIDYGMACHEYENSMSAISEGSYGCIVIFVQHEFFSQCAAWHKSPYLQADNNCYKNYDLENTFPKYLESTRYLTSKYLADICKVARFILRCKITGKERMNQD